MWLSGLTGTTVAQVDKFSIDFRNLNVVQNAPDGFVIPFEVPHSGKITQVLWFLGTTGGQDLTVRYYLPTGTPFEQLSGRPFTLWQPFYGREVGGQWSLQVLEKAPVAPYILETGLTIISRAWPNPNLPVTGPAVPELAGLDDIMVSWLREQEFHAATIAVTKDRKLIYSRGYGWQDRQRTNPISPNAVMRMASLSKPAIEAAVLKLIQDGYFTRNTKFYEYLQIPPMGTVADPRILNGTVDQLLKHTSGLPGNPPGTGQLGRTLNLGRAATMQDTLAFIWTQPLEVDPGTALYSNLGYQILCAMIAKATGMNYGEYIGSQLMEPLGAHTWHHGPAVPGPDEIWYAGDGFAVPEWDYNDTLESVEGPYAMDMDRRPGSTVCSAPDYCRFLNGYFMNGVPKPANLNGIGWAYLFYGSLPGTWTIANEHISPAKGQIVFTIFINQRHEDARGGAIADLNTSVYNYLQSRTVWPSRDLSEVIATPEIVVTGNGQAITSGATTPSASNHTSFGAAYVDSPGITRSYTIGNLGMESLALENDGQPAITLSGAHADDFTINSQPPTTLVSGGTATFSVTFAPSSLGLRQATLSIANNDPDENPFTFTIAGTGEPDEVKPFLTLATPAGNKVSTAPVVITGIAVDDFKLARVEVQLNGSAPLIAALQMGASDAGGNYSAIVEPSYGANTLRVTARDAAGNSAFIERSFVYERRYALTLDRHVPPSIAATPDKGGTLKLTATPTRNATALTRNQDESQQTSDVFPGTMLRVVATARTDYLFSHWTDLPSGAEVTGNAISFIMPQSPLSGPAAVFVANPFVSTGVTQVFQGLLGPSSDSPTNIATVGFVSTTLQAKSGNLSGTVAIEGKTISFTAVLYANGSVWFRVGSEFSSALTFLGKELTLAWREGGLDAILVGMAAAKSEGRLSRTVTAPLALLDPKGKPGFYTLALLPAEQTPARGPQTYPQGSGYASFTLLSKGTFTFTGALADGTKVTQSVSLVEGNNATVFIQLKTPAASTKLGVLSAYLQFAIDQPHRDISSSECLWIRPTVVETSNVASQPYTGGWPGGIAVTIAGAKYDKTMSIQSVLNLDDALADVGNARLSFNGGRLTEPTETAQINITGSKVAKIPRSNAGFTLSVNQTTGRISGTFTPTWSDPGKKLPSFQGILIQGGSHRGGHGFFLSNRLADKDPEAGQMMLGKP